MTKLRLFLYQFAYKGTRLLVTALVVFLAIISLFMGTFMPMNWHEKAEYYYQTSVVLLVLVALGLALYWARGYLARISSVKLFTVCSILFVVLGSYLILGVDPQIRSDAAIVFQGAEFFNHGDYTSLVKQGDYIWMYPHQLGLLTWNRLWIALSNQTTFFFAGNLLLVLLNNALQWKIADLLFHNKLISNYTILLSFLFLPSLFFILFIYGNLPGLFFILLGLYAYLKFEENGHLGWPFLAAVSFAMATLIRNNYFIFVIALLAILAMKFLKTKDMKSLLVALGILIFAFGAPKALNAYYQSETGQAVSQGVPKIAYVTMGLRDVSETNGFWDGYNAGLLPANNYSYEKAAEMAKKDLNERVNAYVTNPSYAIDFFGKKILATWTEPTFQSIWSGPLEDQNQQTHTEILKNIYQGKELYKIINVFLSALLILIYLSSAIFLIGMLNKKEEKLIFLYPFIYLLGGFLFHLIWETKSQYTYSYVYLLFPMAAFGFNQLIQKVEPYFTDLKTKQNRLTTGE